MPEIKAEQAAALQPSLHLVLWPLCTVHYHVQPDFMHVQGVSPVENLILRLKSIASSVAQISELTESEEQRAWKRGQQENV